MTLNSTTRIIDVQSGKLAGGGITQPMTLTWNGDSLSDVRIPIRTKGINILGLKIPRNEAIRVRQSREVDDKSVQKLDEGLLPLAIEIAESMSDQVGAQGEVTFTDGNLNQKRDQVTFIAANSETMAAWSASHRQGSRVRIQLIHPDEDNISEIGTIIFMDENSVTIKLDSPIRRDYYVDYRAFK
jgi:hypothetical protein